MQIQPYLFFDGRCEEALDFYKAAAGAKVEMLMRYKENPDRGDGSMEPPGAADKVMHASFKIGDTMILASDGHCTGKPKFDGFSLAISVKAGGLGKLHVESADGNPIAGAPLGQALERAGFLPSPRGLRLRGASGA